MTLQTLAAFADIADLLSLVFTVLAWRAASSCGVGSKSSTSLPNISSKASSDQHSGSSQ